MIGSRQLAGRVIRVERSSLYLYLLHAYVRCLKSSILCVVLFTENHAVQNLHIKESGVGKLPIVAKVDIRGIAARMF